MTMRRSLVLVIALFVLATGGLVGGQCTHPDRVTSNLGFFAAGDVMQLRSAKYENGGPGWWSWLPSSTGLGVTCSQSPSYNMTASYVAWFMGGDDHLGYSWEETVATVNGCDRYYDAGCEFVVSDEELCDHVGLPWVDVSGEPHPSSGCTVRRGARADQGTYVEIRRVWPLGDPMNTCQSACDYSTEAGFCWVQFAD
jgi:hypothetical protein